MFKFKIRSVAEIIQELFDKGLSEVKLSKGQVNWIHEVTDCLGFDDDPFYMPLFAQLDREDRIISDPNALETLYYKAEMFIDTYNHGDRDPESKRDRDYGTRILAKFYKGAEVGADPVHINWINSQYRADRENAEVAYSIKKAEDRKKYK